MTTAADRVLVLDFSRSSADLRRRPPLPEARMSRRLCPVTGQPYPVAGQLASVAAPPTPVAEHTPTAAAPPPREE